MDLRLPQALDCSDLPKEWPRWKQTFMIYLIANNKMKESETTKIATFLWLIGQRGMEIYNTLFPNDGSVNAMFGTTKKANGKSSIYVRDEKDEKKKGGEKEQEGEKKKGDEEKDADSVVDEKTHVPNTLDDIIVAFDEYCLPTKNTTMEAFKFNMIVQKEKQPFTEFETELRTQLQYCDFECSGCNKSYADRMLLDRIVIGVADKKLQLKLLDGKQQTLTHVIDTCKVFESASANKLLLDKTHVSPREVNAIEQQVVQCVPTSNVPSEVDAIKTKCFNCGQTYSGRHRQFCPAKNIKCNSCGRIGHFARLCKSNNNNNSGNINNNNRQGGFTQQKQVNAVENWSSNGSRCPRYVRVNTNICSMEKAFKMLTKEGFSMVADKFETYPKYLEAIRALEENEYLVDMHVDGLLVFHPIKKAYWACHEYVSRKKFMLQDKATCLVAEMLRPPPGSTVLDMCAAPGMKTIHISNVMQNKGKIFAVEQSPERYQTLCEIVTAAQATIVEPINSDALQLNVADYKSVEYILVDPSCSGSGMQNRMSLGSNEKDPQRLSKLAGLQIKMLLHAMTAFPNVKRIAYSTCSIYQEENEEVIKRCLENCPTFKLLKGKKALRNKWTGVGNPEFKNIGKYCIQSRTEVDLTDGIFIAILEQCRDAD